MVIKAEIRDYKNKNGLQQVRIMISDKGKRRTINTKLFIEAKDWDPVKQRVKNTAANAVILNQFITIKLAEVQRQSATDGITEMIRKKEYRLDDFIKEMTPKLTERNKLETVGNFKSQEKKLLSFSPDALLEDITPDYLERYETYCRSTKKNKDGGVKNSLQFVTQVVNKAIAKGLLPANHIKEFEAKPYKPNKKVHLTRDEMNRWQTVLETQKLTKRETIVGYYYLLSCYTGLRHRDCMKLNKAMKVNGRLMLYTSKTDTPVSLKLSPAVELLFDKCLSLGKLPRTDMCYPYLDGIAALAGIDKHLSFHTARHTFAIQCAVLRIPIEVCSKLMGHSDIATTAIYYRIANHALDSEMDKWL